MAIALNPVFPVVSAKPVPADVVLQPGTVVAAQVLKVLENNFVRIAIANLSIDVLSEVPLQAGQSLQLAVSQNPQGIKLAVVPPGAGSAAPAGDASAAQAAGAAKAVAATAPPSTLSDLQALAVSATVQNAAARQTGLSQLFANLAAATDGQSLPPQVQQAVAKLVALQPELGGALTGAKIQQAFEASGLFREKTLASVPAGQPQPAALPDLKSALIVLRQTLSVALANAESVQSATLGPSTQGTPAPSVPASSIAPPANLLASVLPTPQAAPSSSSIALTSAVVIAAAPPLVPGTEAQDIILPQTRLPKDIDPADVLKATGVFTVARPGAAAAGPIGADTFLHLIQNALQLARAEAGAPAGQATPGQSVAHPLSDLDPGIARTNVPPPPFRGAAPSAQPVAEATLAPDAPQVLAVRQLLDDTDGALARQTLLQIASLPDRADLPGARFDTVQPRWSFEIPFATPQGTAIAQFEVARDGGGNGEAGAATKVWRARFSLDVEPAGPVHAIISLLGGTTSVRMWAERPVTAAQLRANTAQLVHALRSAELTPGDIVIGDGEPPQAATAPAGHFVNLAS